MDYSWHENEPTTFNDNCPAGLRPFLLKTAEKRCIVGEHGCILLQSLPTAHFTIQFNSFLISEDTAIVAQTETGLVSMHVMLGDTLLCSSSTCNLTALNSGTYRLIYIPVGGQYQIYFPKGCYQSVRINLETSFLEQVAVLYPELHRFIEALNSKSKTGFCFPEGHVDFRVKTIIEELKTVDCDRPGEDLLIHARVYELLWLYFAELNCGTEKSSMQGHLKKVQQIHQFISFNLDQELGTSFLARHFGISATTLKRQFKHQYGLTIREFLLQQRMNAAQELLTHTNLSVHSIGARVGYVEFSSFTRAFTRFFGHSPMYSRKKK